MRPAPGPDRCPVQLEARDNEEHGGVDRAVAPAPEEEEEKGHTDRARDVPTRQHGQPEQAPRRRGGRGRDHQDARVAGERGREREAGQVDEAVRGRDEEREVVQPVGVDAPDQRTGHLAERREDDDAERLCAPLSRYAEHHHRQHRPRQRAEEELFGVGGVAVEREQRCQIRRARQWRG
jgi:hypothetical protein